MGINKAYQIIDQYQYYHSFLNANKIVFKYQFGFRKSLHEPCNNEKVNNAMDSGKILIGLFSDLRKAFDTVDHCIRLNKLYKYGIRRTSWNWFKSYLGNNIYATVILYLQPC